METAHDFTVRLQDLLRRERHAMAEFLVALSDFDHRRLWLELGFGSLFDFLHRELGLSKGAAFYRKTAAELIQKFPAIAVPLRDGRLCLMTIAEIARVLTPENVGEVLPRFFGLSKREAAAVAATLLPDPAPPLRTVVTVITAAVPPTLALAAAAQSGPEASVQPVEPISVTPKIEMRGLDEERRAPRPTETRPLTAEVNRFHVTVSRRFLEKLEAARAALSHSHPGASESAILEAGLDLLLERSAKRKGLVKKPRAVPPPSSVPDYVPAHVRRAVWKRDGGRCQFRLASGEICGSTLRVEIDHVTPRALGGPSTEENCRLACRVHNDRSARRVFGDAWMDRFTTNPRTASP